MTDNQTTELTATDRVRKLLDERGFEWSSPRLKPNQTRLPGVKFEPWCSGTLKVTMFNLTPEQAIAATLGNKPDESELTQTYDVGFRNGVMAVFQQLEDIGDYEELQCFIADYWAEGEGNDER
jgi:hypothetical protein